MSESFHQPLRLKAADDEKIDCWRGRFRKGKSLGADPILPGYSYLTSILPPIAKQSRAKNSPLFCVRRDFVWNEMLARKIPSSEGASN